MTKKVVVIGPESTGKSTLSEMLAKHYRTAWVQEYAREYIDFIQRDYAEDDLLKIAEGQIEAQDRKQGEANNDLLFCDTDLYVIKVWSEYKYNNCHPWILQQIARRKYDLYLLTYIDIPWSDDPQREHPETRMREYFYHIYHDIVLNSGMPWGDIRGDYRERLERAVCAIGKYI